MGKRKNKKKNVDNKILIVIITFLIVFSYFELTNDYRLGGILRDLLFNPTREVEPSKLLNTLNQNLQEENSELKSMMGINYSLKDFDIYYATVVERNNSFWMNELTINKGKNDGINENCVVVTEYGLVGKVINASLNTSKIRLITNINNSISVKINNRNKILNVENGNLIVRGINDADKIKVGDMVLTSGLSDNYPEGLTIGKINELIKESDGVGYYAKVTLPHEIDNLRFVALLKRKDK